MIYERVIQIEFNHCDPAGIVFYPRYFEMTNSVVENFFADVAGRSFARMHLEGKGGVPTVRLEANFLAPSRLGDKVIFGLELKRIGGSSLSLTITGWMGDQVRMTADLTLVWVDDMRAAPWPEDMRRRMEDFMEAKA
ncbi:MAG: acyl-CoA thioesterase [Gemmobacter sp.]|jgi:4-hydroxybenzoyl-CoA thioesterase|nr:acyl-CoA thioesterase [Gemmobacter sp.]